MRKAFFGVLFGLLVLGGIALLPTPARAPYAPGEQSVTVLFVGDLMLDRNVARAARLGGAQALFASSTLELFKNADLRILNLEGSITDRPSVAQVDHTLLRFTFEPVLAQETLRLLNADAVSLGNNHALDFGEFGYDDTRAYLSDWSVASFGQPFNESHLSVGLTSHNKDVCLVGYNGTYGSKPAPVIAEIQSMRPACWRVVVFAHWGEEYRATSTPLQETEGHAFIDAGADLVIGAHPHVVEPYEVYKNKAIFYSLGNFVFDQDFSEETQRGLAVLVTFTEKKTSFELIPMRIANEYSSVEGGPVARFSL